jgi:uncharacterized membrane protein (DUF485 family)
MMKNLWQSRKFRLMLFDVVISVASYFTTKYAIPAVSTDILWVIGILQPVMIALITGIAIEDAATLRKVL